MLSSSSFLIIDEYLLYQEEADLIEEYAGITASWLRNAITILSQVANLNAPKKYKAAVKIQSLFRGWSVRKKTHLWNQSAVKIQKTWRGFLGRLKYFKILESTIQKRIIEHHNKSAAIIQSTFRGYYSRKYSHDHLQLRQLQLNATSQVLKCVITQTRKLFKNQHLPGVYSLRNSRCLSKVEKLLAALQIKAYNEKARQARTAHVLKLNDAFETSIRLKDQIPIPFGSCENRE